MNENMRFLLVTKTCTIRTTRLTSKSFEKEQNDESNRFD